MSTRRSGLERWPGVFTRGSVAAGEGMEESIRVGCVETEWGGRADKRQDNSRFPEGMTERKARARALRKGR